MRCSDKPGNPGGSSREALGYQGRCGQQILCSSYWFVLGCSTGNDLMKTKLSDWIA